MLNNEKQEEVVVEEVFVDEDGNEIPEEELHNYVNETNSENDVIEAEVEEAEAEVEVEVVQGEFISEDEIQEEKQEKKSYADFATTEGGKAIFKAKDKVDSLIGKGQEIKDKFIKEANLVETEEAEDLLKEAFEKINELRTRKTGFLGFSERFLPARLNNFVQSTNLKIEQEKRNNQDIVDVSNELFDLIKGKQEEVEGSAFKFNDIKNQMNETLEELSKEGEELQALVKSGELSDMEAFNAERVINIIGSNILTFKENIQNINAAQNIAQQCILHIDQMLPTIENSMKDSLAINGFLNKIDNFKESFMTISKVTSQIQESNSESINDMVRKTNDFEGLLEQNVKSIENRTKGKRELAATLANQHQKQLQLDHKIRDAIVDANEAMSSTEQSPIFLDGDEVGDHFVPERIDIGNQLENKETVKKVKKVVKKKVVKSKNTTE